MTRLIDADALKEAIAEFHQKENERLHTPLWGSIGLNALYIIIDNAPTVPQLDFKEGYKQAIKDGKTNFSRPQGEWILSSIQVVGENWYKCSVCGRKIRTSTYHLKEYPFCHCGADMRGGQDNDPN